MSEIINEKNVSASVEILDEDQPRKMNLDDYFMVVLKQLYGDKYEFPAEGVSGEVVFADYCKYIGMLNSIICKKLYNGEAFGVKFDSAVHLGEDVGIFTSSSEINCKGTGLTVEEFEQKSKENKEKLEAESKAE